MNIHKRASIRDSCHNFHVKTSCQIHWKKRAMIWMVFSNVKFLLHVVCPNMLPASDRSSAIKLRGGFCFLQYEGPMVPHQYIDFLSMKWQWTYGPTLLPWNNHFHTSEACFKPLILGSMASLISSNQPWPLVRWYPRGYHSSSPVWEELMGSLNFFKEVLNRLRM